MKKLIIAMLLISAAVALASEPFVLEPVIPKKYQIVYDTEKGTYIEVPVVDYLQVQRNMDKIARKILEMQYRADSVFVQMDTTSTDGSGYIVVYLPYKYTSSSYFAASSQATNIHIACIPISDSSFAVTSTDFSNVGTSSFLQWVTIGIRKK